MIIFMQKNTACLITNPWRRLIRSALMNNSTRGKLALFDRFVGNLIDREPTEMQMRNRYGNGNEEYQAESFGTITTPIQVQTSSSSINKLKSSYLCTNFDNSFE